MHTPMPSTRLSINSRILEYFVVFVIVAVLAATAYILLSGTIAEARDSRRISDITAIRTALELYRVDHGTYPNVGWTNSSLASWDLLREELKPYLPNLPRDPLNEADDVVEATGAFNYTYYSANGDYALIFRLEQPRRASLYQNVDANFISDGTSKTLRERTGADGIYAIRAP